MSIIRVLLAQNNLKLKDLERITQLNQDIIEDHLKFFQNLKLLFTRWLNNERIYNLNQILNKWKKKTRNIQF